MTMHIRHAADRDWGAIGALLAEINDLHAEALPQVFARIAADARTEAFARERFGADGGAEEGQVFVAEHADTEDADAEQAGEVLGEVLGFVWVRLHTAPPVPLFVPRRWAEVDTLVVAERARHQGIGRALVGRAHRWAAEQGVAEVQVVAWEFNAAALGLYESLGYETARRTLWRALAPPEPGGSDLAGADRGRHVGPQGTEDRRP